MKKLNLNVDLEGLTGLEGLKKQEVVRNVLSNIIIAYSTANRGLSYEEQRIYNNIFNALALSITNDLLVVDVEDTWYAFLVKAMKTGKMPPAKVVSRVFDLLESV